MKKKKTIRKERHDIAVSRESRRRRSVYVAETQRERPLVVVLQVTALRFQPVDRPQDHDDQVERAGDPAHAPETCVAVDRRFSDRFLRRYVRVDTAKDKTQEYIISMTSENSYDGNVAYTVYTAAE